MLTDDDAGPNVLPAPARRRRNWGPLLLILPALLLMLAAFIGPLVVFFQYSFLTFKDGTLRDIYSLDAYRTFFADPYYYGIVWDSLKLSALFTVLTLVVGYPLAYALSRVRHEGLKKIMAVIIFSPLVVSVVVRTYGWIILLADQGPVNWLLKTLHMTTEPVQLVFNRTGVAISLVHVFLPFLVFPVYSVLSKLDLSVKEAAQDLGADWWTTFRRVTLPLSLPGVVAGTQVCFTLGLGAFVTPAMMGGGRVVVLPLTIYRDTTDINWPLAAVSSMVLLVLSLVTVALFNRLLRYSQVD